MTRALRRSYDIGSSGLRGALGSWWAGALRRVPRPVSLRSIRARIVVFTLAAALTPTLTTAWISYAQNTRSLSAKVGEELRAATTHGARELDLWLKERLHELRVFAASYEVTENAERMQGAVGGARLQAQARLAAYLESVETRFPEYRELVVVDPAGVAVASSVAGAAAQARRITDDVRDLAEGVVLGEGSGALLLAVPVVGADGTMSGALAARVSLTRVEELLDAFEQGSVGEMYVVDGAGRVVAGSHGSDAARLVHLPAATPGSVVEYENVRDVDVVGTHAPLERFGWTVVAEAPTSVAYAQIVRLRNTTALLGATSLLIVGALASAFGILMVGPIDRLRDGAARVAGGDLDVSVPVKGGGEIAYLTDVFNTMVARLRQSRGELERLSATDPLTGLYNRRRLMELLDQEARRSRRHRRPFTLLMIDVDYFKQFNDTYGHLAGDEVLRGVAGVLTSAIRAEDHVARYGGEEFMIVMAETELETGVTAAERLQALLAKASLGRGERPVTVSIGVAEYSMADESVECVIGAADEALYGAKEQGRDQIVAAPRRPSGAEAPYLVLASSS